jgi:predicted GIY-YIG superfamily endonuclease
MLSIRAKQARAMPTPLDARPTWLAAARAAALRLRATTHGARGADHSVYLVLLEDRRRACRYGLYVGQTSRDPDMRFDQHRAGYKASRFVARFGVVLLPELVAHLNPMRRWEAVELEAALAEELRRARIPWVEGGH